MKFLYFAGLLFFLSCNKNQLSPNNSSNQNQNNLATDNANSFNKSWEKWLQLKEKNANSYWYETSFLSWSGHGNSTKIIVKNGEVIGRKYEAFKQAPTQEILESFEENKANLGSHSSGAKPILFDKVYEDCKNNILTQNAENNTIYFETDSLGLLKTCGFVPKNCADDCFQGYRISSFNWQK